MRTHCCISLPLRRGSSVEIHCAFDPAMRNARVKPEPRSSAIDQHRACTAVSLAASEARSLEAQIVAKNVEQRRIFIVDGHLVPPVVHAQGVCRAQAIKAH